ncbi:MAG: permease prefix domain 1-containing protein [Oscillospiraceae bacterium]|nr:permease prefix domain 1-containing protein [Oscillospiraceae bacterium]
MEDFKDFLDAVCRFLPRATEEERAALRKELSDHLCDHAEFLEQCGVPPEEAAQRAVAAMGSAEIIGRDYNATLSPVWLLIGRICKTVSVLLILLSVGMLLNTGGNLAGNLKARFSPASYAMSHGQMLTQIPLDEKISVGRSILRCYGAGIGLDAQSEYFFYLDTVLYNRNPLQAAPQCTPLLEVAADGTVDRFGGGGGSGGAYWRQWCYALSYGAPAITVSITYAGQVTSLEIPLNWEGVP